MILIKKLLTLVLPPKTLGRTVTSFAHNYVGRPKGPGLPQYFTLKTLLIFIHAAQIAASQCILRSAPPPMILTVFTTHHETAATTQKSF